MEGKKLREIDCGYGDTVRCVDTGIEFVISWPDIEILEGSYIVINSLKKNKEERLKRQLDERRHKEVMECIKESGYKQNRPERYGNSALTLGLFTVGLGT